MPKWTGYLDDDYDTTEDYQQVVRIPSKPKTFIKEDVVRFEKRPKKEKDIKN